MNLSLKKIFRRFYLHAYSGIVNQAVNHVGNPVGKPFSLHETTKRILYRTF